MRDPQFRFEDLEIWRRAATMSGSLFKLADDLEKQKVFRFAEQRRGATLSITNKFAEGSGSGSDPDFASFLNYARRSVFEVANMLILFKREGYLGQIDITGRLGELEEQSKMILAFRRRLKP